jgi:hypothetical protein
MHTNKGVEKGVTVVLQLCHSCVTVVLQWCHSGPIPCHIFLRHGGVHTAMELESDGHGVRNCRSWCWGVTVMVLKGEGVPCRILLRDGGVHTVQHYIQCFYQCYLTIILELS